MKSHGSMFAVAVSAALVLALLWFVASRGGRPAAPDRGAALGASAESSDAVRGIGAPRQLEEEAARQALDQLGAPEGAPDEVAEAGELRFTFISWADGAPLAQPGRWRLVSQRDSARVVEFQSAPGGRATVVGVDPAAPWWLTSLDEALILSGARFLPDSNGEATIPVLLASKTLVEVSERGGGPIAGAGVCVASWIMDGEPPPDAHALPRFTDAEGRVELGYTADRGDFVIDVWADGYFPLQVKPPGPEADGGVHVVRVSLVAFDAEEAGSIVFDLEGGAGDWSLAAIPPDESAGWDDESELVLGRAALGQALAIPRALFDTDHWVIRHADLRYTLNATALHDVDWSRPVAVKIPELCELTLQIEDPGVSASAYGLRLTGELEALPAGFRNLQVGLPEPATLPRTERVRRYRLPRGLQVSAKVQPDLGRVAEETFELTEAAQEHTIVLSAGDDGALLSIYSASPLQREVAIDVRYLRMIERAEPIGGGRYHLRVPQDARCLRLIDRDGVRTGVHFLGEPLDEDLEFSLPMIQAERTSFTLVDSAGEPLLGTTLTLRPDGRDPYEPGAAFGKREVIAGRVVLQRENMLFGTAGRGGRLEMMLPRGEYSACDQGAYGASVALEAREVLTPTEALISVTGAGQHFELVFERLRTVRIDVTAIDTLPGAQRNWAFERSTSHWPETFSGDVGEFTIGEAACTLHVSTPDGRRSRALGVEAGARDLVLRLEARDFE